MIVKIESGNRVARLRLLRLFFKTERLALRIELDHAVALGIVDRVGKDARPARCCAASLQTLDEIVSVENVVAETPARSRTGADEFVANQKCLRDAFGLRLHRVLKMDAEADAITEQVARNRGRSSGVEMIRMSRMPASISVESG